MMTDSCANLHALAQQLAVLSNELRNNTDPESRVALLRKFRVLLAQADKIVAEETPHE
jgi:hypothetical protein